MCTLHIQSLRQTLQLFRQVTTSLYTHLSRCVNVYLVLRITNSYDFLKQQGAIISNLNTYNISFKNF